MLDKKRAIIYARVSSRGQDDPESVSIPDQKVTCEKYAIKLGYDVVKIFKETKSGWKEGARDVYFDEMLPYIDKHRPHNLIFHFHDRLSRSPEDFEELIKLCKEINHNLIIHDIYKKRHFGILDPEAYEELAQMRKDIIDAGLFSARLRFKVMRMTRRKRLERGLFPGYAPTGYVNNVILNTIELDPERASLVKEAFELMAIGRFSIDDLTKEMRKRGLTTRIQKKDLRGKAEPNPVTRKQMYNILTNKFYTGKFNWYGEEWSNKGISNNQEPTYSILVSEALFQRVQEVLRSHRKADRAVRKAENWIYKGLLKCRHCGCDLVAQKHIKNKGKPNEKEYITYTCTSGKITTDPDYYEKNFGELCSGKKIKRCPQKYWSEEKITEFVERELEELKFDEDTFKWLREQVNGDIAERKENADKLKQQYMKRQAQLETEMSNLFRNYQAGRIDEKDLEAYKVSRKKIKEELEEIKKEIEKLESQEEEHLEIGIATLEAAHTFKNLYQAKYSAKNGTEKALKHAEVLNQAKKIIMMGAMFRTIVCDKPIIKRGGKHIRVESYPDSEFIWNEPFATLNLLKLEEEIEEHDKQKKYWLPAKIKKVEPGTPGGI